MPIDEREELARIILHRIAIQSPDNPFTAEQWADALLAAGWHRDTSRILTDEEATEAVMNADIDANGVGTGAWDERIVRALARVNIRLVRVEGDES